MKPGFLFGLDAQEIAPEKRRDYFAKWVTSPENPYFTKVIANRLWKDTFDYGLVADPDDSRKSPDPLYPEVVELLEQAMLAAEYDLKEFKEISVVVAEAEEKRRTLQRKISLLRTEAAKARSNGDMAAARDTFRKIREVQRKFGNQYRGGGSMMEASETATKAGSALTRRYRINRPDQPEVRMRASELPVPARTGSLLAEFGASDATSPSAAHTEATVPQILRLLNGNETVLLTNRKNAFARALHSLESPEERLEFLFLSLDSAFPSESEKNDFLAEVAIPSTQFHQHL